MNTKNNISKAFSDLVANLAKCAKILLVTYNSKSTKQHTNE
ncbi:hypothetical protein ACWIUD_08920 [Helicobacter sp. 23-1044]